MSYQSPAAKRPVKRRRDNTPLILAIVTLMAMPALGFAVYKFVINKPEQVASDDSYAAALAAASATPTPEPTPPEPPRIKIEIPNTPVIPSAGIFEGSFKPGMISGQTSGGMIGGGGASVDVSGSVSKAWKKVEESIERKKGLVIWLFDGTMSCDARRESVATALESAYPSLAKPAAESSAAAAPAGAAPGGSTTAAKPAGPDDARLLTVVARYGDRLEYLTPAPTDDQEAIFSALRTVKSPGTGKIENTFAAVQEAVEKYAEYASPPNMREISVVVVTDEVGNDQAKRDDTLAAVQKSRAVVFVIGQAATFGSVGNQQAGEATDYFQGPESRELEQPPLDGPYGGSMMGQECGIGPYSLVHLCRESGGEFYASSSMMSGSPLPPKYLPRYMSEKEYQAYRSGNKALQALIAAAQLKPATPIGITSSVFTVDEAGAANVRDIDLAQRPVALILPDIESQYAKLKEGEADRDKLLEPRQKAAYDLAMGRAMAMLVRAKGYNVLLAAFKAGGRKGDKPETRTWTLMQGEGVEKDSVLTSMSKKAKDYLERVMKEHPGTQWASAAQQELTQPIGWVWVEG